MKSKWKAKIGWLMSLTAIIALTAAPAWATSDRFIPENGYGAQLYTMDYTGDVGYQGSLDIVYAEVAEFPEDQTPWKTRCIMKVENGTFHYLNEVYKIRVMLYDYTGKTVMPLALLDVPDMCWGQGVKLDANTDTIWFSYTASPCGNDRWYSFPWDETLKAYQNEEEENAPLLFDNADYDYEMNCNWEMEVSTDPDPVEGATGQGGRRFFAGLNSCDWDDPHSVWFRNGDNWQKVVEIGGNSCGFAFDNAGNLWSGSYMIGDFNYVLMWTAAQIDAAVRSGPVLYTSNATVSIALPSVEGHKAGVNDVECAPDGNVYVSANGGWSEPPLPPDTECGYVLKIENNGGDEWPTTYTIIGYGSSVTGQWDWLKAVAYDGESFLEDDGSVTGALTYTDPTHVGLTGEMGLTANRLYLDHDWWAQAQPPGADTVSAITRAADSDVVNEAPAPDGVPDAVDNCYLTPTEDECQVDSDQDMYGNICDCDVDNNEVVAIGDYTIFSGDWGSSEPDSDFDSNGVVAIGDYTIFSGSWSQEAPFY